MKGRNGQTTNSSQNAGRGNASLKQFGTATNYRGDSGHRGSCCTQRGGWKEGRPQMAQIAADVEGITERTRVHALSSPRPPRLRIEMSLKLTPTPKKRFLRVRHKCTTLILWHDSRKSSCAGWGNTPPCGARTRKVSFSSTTRPTKKW